MRTLLSIFIISIASTSYAEQDKELLTPAINVLKESYYELQELKAKFKEIESIGNSKNLSSEVIQPNATAFLDRKAQMGSEYEAVQYANLSQSIKDSKELLVFGKLSSIKTCDDLNRLFEKKIDTLLGNFDKPRYFNHAGESLPLPKYNRPIYVSLSYTQSKCTLYKQLPSRISELTGRIKALEGSLNMKASDALKSHQSTVQTVEGYVRPIVEPIVNFLTSTKLTENSAPVYGLDDENDPLGLKYNGFATQ